MKKTVFLHRIILIPLICLCFLFPSCSGGDGHESTESTESPVSEQRRNNSSISDSTPARQDIELIAPPSQVDLGDGWMQDVQRQRAVENGVMLQANVDTSVMSINYYDAQEVDSSNLLASDSVGDLEVIDYGPVGEMPVEMMRPSIYIQFNQPMVPLARLGDVMESHPRVRIEPAVEGVFRWYGTSLLSFEPSEPLSRHALYKIQVDKRIESLYGNRLSRNLDFTFFIEAVDFQAVFFDSNESPFVLSDNIPLERIERIYVLFNQSVDHSHIGDALELKAGSRSVPFQVRQLTSQDGGSDRAAHRMVVIEPETDRIPLDSSLKLTLRRGASSFPEGPERTNSRTLEFHTLRPLRYQNHSLRNLGMPEDPQGSKNALYISFNQPLAEDALRYIETPFEGYDPMEQGSIYGAFIRLNDLPVSYGDSYTIVLKEGLEDQYGQSLESSMELEVEVPNAASYLYAPQDYHTLEAVYTPRIIYHFQNLDSGTLSINGNSVDITQGQLENQANFRMVDLTEWLNDAGYGKVRLVWDYNYHYTTYQGQRRNRTDERDLVVQVTDMGLSVRYAYNKILVWVNSLSSGEPVSGANVTLYGISNRPVLDHPVQTNQNGLAVIPIEPGNFNRWFINSSRHNQLELRVQVNKDQDQADYEVRSTQSANRFGVNQSRPMYAERENQRVFFFTDRGIYKPGEEVVIRGMDWSQSIGEFSPYVGPYTVVLYEPGYRGERILSMRGTTSESGGFYLRIPLAQTMDPENYVLKYYRGVEEGYSRHQISFQVAHFRRLNTQVNMNVPAREFLRSDGISIPVEASYLAGGAMAGGSLSYYVTRQSDTFIPPGDQWRNWRWGPSGYDGEKLVSSGDDSLDSLGRYNISVPTDEWGISGKPYRYIFEATVEDIDRQTVSTAASVFCHPAQWYIGAKLGSAVEGWWSPFVSLDQDQSLNLAMIDLDGKLVEENLEVHLRLTRGEYRVVQQQGVADRINTRYEWVEEEVESSDINLRSGMGQYRFTPEEPGRYTAEIASMDPQGRTIRTELSFYATGGRWIRWASNNDEDINMIPDRDLYFPGDKANIMIQSPLPEGRYLLTYEGFGISQERIIELNSSTDLIEIPIDESMIPVQYITLTSFRNRESLPSSYFEPDFGRPKAYFGAVQLNISTQPREMDIEIIENQSVYRPGEEAEVLIKVTRDGEPVADAELIFLAVDRGVLDLINYHVPNPLDFFYNRANFPLHVNGDDSRRLLLAPVTYDVSNLIGGDGEEGGKLDRREDFSPLAVFEPILRTNQDGLAVSRFTLPDTLTTYRSTAIALQGNRLGYTEDELYVQNPINLRTALPRRFRLRDTAFAGCIIHNLDSEPHEVRLSVQSDILEIAGEDEKVLQIPSGGIYEVPFVLEAPTTGRGEIIFTLHSDVLNEELVNEVVVERPLIKEAFTTIGAITVEDSDQLEEGLIIPGNIAQGYGGLDFSMDSTMMPFLDHHINALTSQDYLGLSYMMYRMLPMILFPEYTDSHYGESPDWGFRQMSRHQNSEGGLYRNYSDYPSYYLSCQGAILIGLGMEQDLQQAHVNEDLLLSYLKNHYSDKSPYVKAMAIYAMALLGDIDKRLWEDCIAEEEDELGLSGYALIAQAFSIAGDNRRSRELYEYIKRFTSQGTQGIDIQETWEAWNYFDSHYQQTAHLLSLSLTHGENSLWIMKLARGLNPDRHSSPWLSYNDHFWSLVALNHLKGMELGENTDYSGSILLNQQSLWDTNFSGASQGGEHRFFAFEEEPLLSQERDLLHSLVYQREGQGSLYYSSTIHYALPAEVAPARDEGISVVAMVETLEGEAVEEELTLGETYRMRVILSTTKDRSFLQLSVPVPSGTDIVDPSFSSSSRFVPNEGVFQESWNRNTGYGDSQTYIGEGYVDFYSWYFWWIRPQIHIYDNRIDYQWDSIYKGQREVSFLFRATTPGVYPTPPATASLEFEPEVFGRSDGRLYVIR